MVEEGGKGRGKGAQRQGIGHGKKGKAGIWRGGGHGSSGKKVSEQEKADEKKKKNTQQVDSQKTP